MNKEIAKREMSLVSSTDFPDEKVALIRSLVAPKANKEELELFLYQCQRTGLDPLVRQIYAIHRWNSQQGRETMTIQTSIDGFRVIAERSGVYAGQSEPEFEEDANGKLILCKVRVYKFHPITHTRYEAAVGVAYWKEYVQTGKDGNPSGLWAKMGHVMLSKVAEAVALRKCFPLDLSGLYTSDEIETEDVQPIDITTDQKLLPTTAATVTTITTPATQTAVAELTEAELLEIKDLVSKCGNGNALTNAFKSLSADKQGNQKVKNVFNERREELKKPIAQPANN